MTQTNRTYTRTAGRAAERGPFSGPYCVRCIGPHCAYYLQDFDRSGLRGRIRYYETARAARIAARAEARRMGRFDARIDAAIFDAEGRVADAFSYSGPWESAGPIDPLAPEKPARVALVYPGNEARFLPGAYRTLRGAQRAARAAFLEAVIAASGAEAGPETGAGPEAPEGVRVIDTSRNDREYPDGAVWAELGNPHGRWITY